MQIYESGQNYLARKHAIRTAVSLALVGWAPQAFAQTDSGNQEQEEIFELSPFEVTGQEDQGYRATSTLAGTRIRTDLKDVGSAISVYTEEFLKDVGATDTGTLLQYATNAEVGGTQGTYAGLGNGATLDEESSLISPTSSNRVRGLSAAENTRDFFVSDIPWDSYNVQRVDVQRGPNSILFGLGKPAGIINATMAGAAMADDNEVQIRFGSYGSMRASASMNKVLVEDQLAIRVAALRDDAKFQQDPAFEEDTRIYTALRWEPQWGGDSMSTTINLKYENGEIESNRPRTVPPYDSVTPWFRPTEISASNPFGGMNKASAPNPWDSFSDYQQSSGDFYNPWFGGGGVEAQQPYWTVDGVSGSVMEGRGGFINNAARNWDGSIRGTAQGLEGLRFTSPMTGIDGLANTAQDLGLPNSGYGQYRNQSLTDPTIFDFYNQLIDGDTKNEWSNWDAYNFDFQQTWLDNRIGANLIYDRQKFERGGESMLNWRPTLQLDLAQTLDNLEPNPNFARPYLVSGSGGSGTSWESDREVMRASLFAELRADDFLQQDSFLAKLLGKHRFNAVYSDEDFRTEDRGWNRKGNSTEFWSYVFANDGTDTAFNSRPPSAIIYLGDSLASRNSASGANIPRITGSFDINDGPIRLFDTVWTANSSVGFGDAWTIPGVYSEMFNADTPPDRDDPAPDGWFQNSNPDNYNGWTPYDINLWSYDMGADPRTTTRAVLEQRETSSVAATWQGYFWNDAVVATIGWREDEIKSRSYRAVGDPTNNSIRDLSPGVYQLPDTYLPEQILKDDSVSGGVVVHLNRLLNDRLPLNVSLSYNESSNFEVANQRNDLYGNPIDNPSGETEDIGILLSTKDGRYSFRAIKYESTVDKGNSDLSPDGIGSTVVNGLRWRNVFLYSLSNYPWSSRDAPQGRNQASSGYPIDGDPSSPYAVELGSPEEQALEDSMVAGWNEIQGWLQEKSFFDAWGFTPVAQSDLTVPSVYEADRAGNTPADPSQVYLYEYSVPQNFAVTADLISKGYEYEFTANPTDNWRISFNASETEAIRNNVGGELINEFVDYMDGALIGTPAGNMPRWGNSTASGRIVSEWSNWRANYVRMKLQEGTAVPEMRKWRYNVVTNYTFSEGVLDGFGIGGSYRWQDKVAIGYPLVPLGPGSDEYTFDVDNPIYGPSEDFIDLWASYSMQLGDRIDWKIQLNIRNAFADDQLIPISLQPDDVTWAAARTAPVQEWFLTNTFSF